VLSVSSVVNSKIPPAFDPVGAFLVRRAELARGWGVDALGEETLEDLGVPEFVELLQAFPSGSVGEYASLSSWE
jgi:hypothetical protein